MFIPEPGDHFHIYDERRGLLKATAFVCTGLATLYREGSCGKDMNVVYAMIVAGAGKQGEKLVFDRSMVSFWPVQPGYIDHLLGVVPCRVPLAADPEFSEMIKAVVGKYAK